MKHSFVLYVEPQASASQSELIRRLTSLLSATSDLVCRVEPLHEQDSSVSADYAQRMELFSRMAVVTLKDGQGLPFQHPQLARIQRFLIPLPESYERLRLEQDLVRASLKEAMSSGDIPSGDLLHLFERYRSLYATAYLSHLAEFERSAHALARDLPSFSHLVFVLSQLDALPDLGSQVAPEFGQQLQELTDRFRPLGISQTEQTRILTFEPMIRGISLFTPLPHEEAGPFEASLRTALRKKLTKLSEASVLAVLRASKDPAIQKLLKLTQLTNLEQISTLFTQNTAPKLVAALGALLGATHGALSVGDIPLGPRTIATEEDIQTASSEFAAFLQERLRAGPLVLAA